MSSEFDMTQYLDLFLQEADEQLEILEQEMLKLEGDPNPTRLQSIFRAAHTLKGSSRAMGFAHFAHLTHELENVLDLLRNDQLAVDTELASALLACIDTLAQMAGSIQDGKGDDIDIESLVRELQSFSNRGPAELKLVTSEPVVALDEAVHRTLNDVAAHETVFHARFRLRPDCVMRFARAYMAIEIAQSNGELLHAVPERERLEEEQFDSSFELYFHNEATLEELRASFGQISEVEWFEVSEWDGSASVPASTQVQSGNPLPQPPAPMGKPTAAPDASAAAPRKAESSQTVRVDVTRLDALMNLVGELVIDRTRIAQIGSELGAKFKDRNIEELNETVGHIARITGDLQDQIMKARMMPIETVFNRFPRVVRDLAIKLNKDVRLELVGGDTELDRSVIEVIGDPLLHVIRNSLDHGIEKPEFRLANGKPAQGRITVFAKHQENHIVIDVADDGSGIDVQKVKAKAIANGLMSREAAERISDKEALQLIFSSGLSTAEAVSEVSGRGVGMDIVRSNIQKLGGIIDLETTPGQGTKTSLRLPLTLAIIRGLLVQSSGNVYVIPLGSVIETLLVHRKDVQTVNKHEVIVIRGVTTPLLNMRTFFAPKRPETRQEKDLFFVVIVGLAEQRVGIVVDELIGEQEVVIKSLSRFCGEVPGISGATILGDGNVALIVDVNGIVPN